jgi:hypothetical protein
VVLNDNTPRHEHMVNMIYTYVSTLFFNTLKLFSRHTLFSHCVILIFIISAQVYANTGRF